MKIAGFEQDLEEKYSSYDYDGKTADGVIIRTGNIRAQNPAWYAAGQTWVSVALGLIVIGFAVFVISKRCKQGI